MLRKLLKWGVAGCIILACLGAAFSLYAHFLVDYSLENLAFAISVTQKDPGMIPQSHQMVYESMVEDLILEEAAQTDVDFKSLVLLELASRSLDEAVERAGHVRGKIYLTEAMKDKANDRSRLLRTTDIGYNFLRRAYETFFSVIRYFKALIFKKDEQPVELSSILLLSQAEEMEKVWDFDKAADLYKKYIKAYPDRPDTAFVIISLGRVLIKQKKWDEAAEWLRKVRRDYTGEEGGMVAQGLLNKIDTYKSREKEVARLEELLTLHQNTPLEESLQFRLGLTYLSIYSLNEAQGLFRKLKDASDNDIRQKAKFYLGWIYKLQSQYDRSAEVMLALLDEQTIAREMRLGLEAQLADIYYQKRDIETSLEYYEMLSGEARAGIIERKAAMEAWVGLSEIEQGVVHTFNRGNPVEGSTHLLRAGELASAQDLKLLQEQIDEDRGNNLRELAFKKLKAGQVSLAWELFKKYLVMNPEDAWTHSGLSTIHVLISDIRAAYDYAALGHQYQQDEYTTAVFAYVHGLLERYEESIELYEEAYAINKDYVSAHYNLAVMYMRTEQYEPALEHFELLEKQFKETKTRNTMLSKILNNMGFTLWQLERREEAIKRFEQAIEVTPTFVDAKRNLDDIAMGTPPQTVTPPQTLGMQE